MWSGQRGSRELFWPLSQIGFLITQSVSQPSRAHPSVVMAKMFFTSMPCSSKWSAEAFATSSSPHIKMVTEHFYSLALCSKVSPITISCNSGQTWNVIDNHILLQGHLIQPHNSFPLFVASAGKERVFNKWMVSVLCHTATIERYTFSHCAESFSNTAFQSMHWQGPLDWLSLSCFSLKVILVLGFNPTYWSVPCQTKSKCSCPKHLKLKKYPLPFGKPSNQWLIGVYLYFCLYHNVLELSKYNFTTYIQLYIYLYCNGHLWAHV